MTVSGQLNRSVVVAVIAVRVMQTSIDHVVNVLAMRYRLMSATSAVDMTRATGFGSTPLWVRGADRDQMLVHMIAVRVMQMTFMQIVDMPIVEHRRVAAVRAMLVRMIRMMRLCTGGHDGPFLCL
jgi:hypothetical protein